MIGPAARCDANGCRPAPVLPRIAGKSLRSEGTRKLERPRHDLEPRGRRSGPLTVELDREARRFDGHDVFAGAARVVGEGGACRDTSWAGRRGGRARHGRRSECRTARRRAWPRGTSSSRRRGSGRWRRRRRSSSPPDFLIHGYRSARWSASARTPRASPSSTRSFPPSAFEVSFVSCAIAPEIPTPATLAKYARAFAPDQARYEARPRSISRATRPRDGDGGVEIPWDPERSHEVPARAPGDHGQVEAALLGDATGRLRSPSRRHRLRRGARPRPDGLRSEGAELPWLREMRASSGRPSGRAVCDLRPALSVDPPADAGLTRKTVRSRSNDRCGRPWPCRARSASCGRPRHEARRRRSGRIRPRRRCRSR